MKKILFTVFLALLLFGISFRSIAAESVSVQDPSPSPSSVSSFELFWPIVAGKTEGDSLYFVKTLKEGVRGMLIFGFAQKADYSIFLVTKRIVEIEKLILEGKSDLAEKSMIKAFKQIDRADFNITQALAEGVPFKGHATNMVNQLSNLETFTPTLIARSDRNKESLTKILEKIISLKTRLL